MNSGGGNRPNPDLNLARPACLWMLYEATSGGLDLKPRNVEWNWQTLGDIQESMTLRWRLLECFPVKRLSYKGKKTVISW